jgi:hypothetical protein
VGTALGDGQLFEARLDYFAGEYPSRVEVRDFDGDGILDVATSHEYSKDVYFFKGVGDGLLQLVHTSPGCDSIKDMAAGDFDNDDDLDLVLLKHIDSSLCVIFNDGTGSFGSPLEIPGLSLPHCLCAADFDGDNVTDIGVGCLDDYALCIIISNGDGTFDDSLRTTAPQWTFGMDLCAVDIDGDYDNDIVMTGGIIPPGKTCVFGNDGSGGFQLLSSIEHGAWTNGVVCAELNGQPPMEIASVDGYGDCVYILQLNDDYEFVGPPVSYPAGEEPCEIVAGDINRDGDVDLVSVSTKSDGLTLLFNDGNAAFNQTAFWRTSGDPVSARVADLDDNSVLDIVAACGNDMISVLEGRGDGTFVAAEQLQVGRRLVGVVTSNLNDDPAIDIATVDRDSNSVAILFGIGHGRFEYAGDYAVGEHPLHLAAADLDGDGDNDLVVANSGSDDISLLFNLGDGDFSVPTNTSGFDTPFFVASEDLDNDDDFDLVIVCYGTSEVAVMLNDGAGAFHETTRCAVSMLPTAVHIQDLNHDDSVDMVVAHDYPYDIVQVLMGNGDGTFQEPVDYIAGNHPAALTSADFNGDSHYDIAIGSDWSSQVGVLPGFGDGTFGAPYYFGQSYHNPNVWAADFDFDGDYDIAAGKYNGLFMYLNDGYGTFTCPMIFGMIGPASPNASAVGDLDGDGDEDVVFATRNSSYGLTLAFNRMILDYIAGDANDDGMVDIDDVVFVLEFIFLEGLPPEPLLAADADCSGDVSIDDVVYLISYIFSGGHAPGDPDGDGEPDC